MADVQRPNFFIVGAPKCGTTSLYEYLRVHPDVFMPDRKEPMFFCTDFEKPRPRMTEEEYLALFRSAGGVKRIGEGSTWYLYSEKAREGIKAFAPDARIIIMLRDPVDMVSSLHSQMRWNGIEDIPDLEEALGAEEERRKGRRLPPIPFPVPLMIYRDLARYSNYIEPYFEQYGPENVHVIIFEDFAQNTELCYRDVCEFLGIDHSFRPHFDVHNVNKRLRSVQLRRLTRYGSPLRPLRYVLPRPVRQKLKGALLKANTKVERRLPPPATLRRRLEEEFSSEIAHLSTILGRDLTAFWCRDSLPARSAPLN